MSFEAVMQAVLHVIAQALMIPVMIVLVLLVAFSVFCIGHIIVEFFTERRLFKASDTDDVNAIYDATYADVPAVIASTSLLGPQKAALEMVANNMGLSDGDLFAVARSETKKVTRRYTNLVKVTDLATKIAPMMGLMCTLIPLGPGIVAMGGGDVATLSNSLLVAFDGTVAGLLGAVVSMCISTVRKKWYEEYISSVEALMDSLLEKAERARQEGVVLPHNFSRAELDELRRKGFGPIEEDQSAAGAEEA